jgi:hypothetical protein
MQNIDIKTMEESIIDDYTIYYKNSYYSCYLYEEYEQSINNYILQHNKDTTMEYYSSNNNSETIMSYKSTNIIYEVNITKIDYNNFHVKIYLCNLLKDTDILKNNEYNEIYKSIQETKDEIVEWNNYFNLKKKKRNVDWEIDKLIEDF